MTPPGARVPLKLSLDALVALDAIARRGSFTKAAAELHRVPSALSYTVAQAESALGVLLFDRSGRSSRLTPIGEGLLAEGREILGRLHDLECRVEAHRQGWEGEVRIAVDTLFGLRWIHALMPAFDALQSQTRVRLCEEVMDGTWDSLIQGRADLIVAAQDTGAMPNSGVKVCALGSIELCFVSSPSHPLARLAAQLDRPLREADLRPYRQVSIADSSLVLAARTSHLAPGQNTLTVPTLRDKLEAIECGLGAGFVPSHAAQAGLQAGTLHALDLDPSRSEAPFCLAWRPAGIGRAAAWFVDQLLNQDLLPGLVRASPDRAGHRRRVSAGAIEPTPGPVDPQ
jgi:DNA-binding transcriptional LysR family regulator